MINDIPTAMDEFYQVVKSASSTDAPDVIVRLAGGMPHNVAITALARLFVISHTWGEFDRARALAARGDGD